MKKLVCRDLGGPCNMELTGDSFREIGKKSYDHVMEQMNNSDEAHKAAADKMRNVSPEEHRSRMAEYEKRYNEAPNI